jgi:hypothetical protein
VGDVLFTERNARVTAFVRMLLSSHRGEALVALLSSMLFVLLSPHRGESLPEQSDTIALPQGRRCLLHFGATAN